MNAERADGTPRVLWIHDADVASPRAEEILVRAIPEVQIDRVVDQEGLENALVSGEIDLVVTGHPLGWTDSIEVIRRLKAVRPGCPVIMFTAQGDEDTAVTAMKNGLDDYIPKSSGAFERLATAARQALEKTNHRPAADRATWQKPDLFDQVPVGLCRLSRDGLLVDINQAILDLFGIKRRAALLGSRLSDRYVRDNDRLRWERTLSQPEGTGYLEVQIQRKDGEVRWVALSVNAVYDAQGRVPYYECSLRDISDRIRSDEELRRYAARLKILREIDRAILGSQSPEAIAKATLLHILNLIPCDRGSVAVFEPDTNQATVFATYGRGDRQFGTGALLSPATFRELHQLNHGSVQAVDEISDLPDPSPWVQSLISEGVRSFLRAPLQFQNTLIGSLNLESMTPYFFTGEHLESAREVADSLAIAIHEAQLRARVLQLAITDELTGLYNRRHFFDLGSREFDRAKRYHRPLTAVLLDIDSFKQVNDEFGHATGDEVLQTIARRSQDALREIDILGRIGGDEFAILLPETDLPAAHLVADRLRKHIGDRPILTESRALNVTVSLGVARALRSTASLSELLDRADAAMYNAKQGGGDAVTMK